MVSDESREENASECRGLHSPVKLSDVVVVGGGGGGIGTVHVQVRTSRVSLGELAVAKRARDAGLGAAEGFGSGYSGSGGGEQVRCVVGDGACIAHAGKWLVGWLVGWRSVAAATNLGGPANKQNEWTLMFGRKTTVQTIDQSI